MVAVPALLALARSDLPRGRRIVNALIVFLAPALADERLYRVGAAVEARLVERWGGPLLAQAPILEGDPA